METSTDTGYLPPTTAQQTQATPAEKTAAFPSKTTGEKWFDRIRFFIGEGFILGLTAALAYVAKYGKDSYGPIPNLLKRMDKGINDTLLEHTPLGKSGITSFLGKNNNENGNRIAEAISSATTLMHGGNLFIPVMKFLQDRKQRIVGYINKHWGNPGELEAGNNRLSSQEKESWGDIIKGRIGSWLIIFSGFMSADLLVGKKNGTDIFWIDWVKDKVGRVVSRITKEGAEIAKVPLTEGLSDVMRENKAYRFGKILALDILATTAALVAWTTISKISAASRRKKVLRGSAEEFVPKVSNASSDTGISEEKQQNNSVDNTAQPSYVSRLGTRPVDYRTLAESAPLGQAVAIH